MLFSNTKSNLIAVKQRRNWHRHDYSDSGASKVCEVYPFSTYQFIVFYALKTLVNMMPLQQSC